MMEQKTAFALVLLVGFALLLFGCAGSSGTPSQPSGSAPTVQQGTPPGSGEAPNQNQQGNVAPPSQGGQMNTQPSAPPSNSTQYQPTTGIGSLNDNDTNIGNSDSDGAAYTELPVYNGS
jgi:hypothetical protein